MNGPSYFIQQWNVRSLPETLENDERLGGSKGSSHWLLRTIQNLREPTKLAVEFRKTHRRNAGCADGDQRSEAVIIGNIFKALKVNQHVTELMIMNMPQMHLIDLVLEANDRITKLSLFMGNDFFYNYDNCDCRLDSFLDGRCHKLKYKVLRRLLMRGPQIELSLEGRRIGDLCVPLANAIRNNSTLTSLTISHCRFFGTWLNTIFKVVPSCSALSKLEISNSGLEEYCNACAIGDMLKGSATLTELILSGNRLGHWLKPICGALLTNSTLTKLDLSHNGITVTSARHLAKVLRDCSTLTELCLHGNPISKPDIVCALLHNTTLTKLQFEGTHPGLQFRWTELIRHNRALTDVRLSINFTMGNGFAKALRENPSLCTLDLSCSHMTFGLIEGLGEALKHNRSLVELKLCTCNEINPDSQPYHVFGEGLKANSTLKSLWVKETIKTEQGREELAIAIAKALAVNKGLTTLALVVWDMVKECFSLLADGLEQNTTLTVLQLGNVQLDDKTTPILARGLKSNTSLKCLDLHSLDCNGAMHLKEALSMNTSLEVLKIQKVVRQEEDAMIDALANIIKENKSLKRLQIPYNLETNKLGKEALMKAYKENADLKCKILRSNVGSEYVDELGNDADWSESCFWYCHRLNSTGGVSWSHGSFPATLWPAALILADARSSPESPDLLFHFIVEKPYMFKKL